MRGKFLLIDGLDGSGKGVFLDAMKRTATEDGMRLFDLHSFWKETGRHPTTVEIGDATLLFSSEPTYALAGKVLRDELIRKGGSYSVAAIAQAFALDRQLLYEQVLIPALTKGIGVIQARSVSTSLVYQPLDAERKGEQFSLEDVQQLPGNKLALQKEWMPDLVVIPVVDAVESDRRLGARSKQDDARFEELAFQQGAKERFESDWFRQLYESAGAEVVYVDTSTSVEHSREEAARLFHKLFR